MWMVGRSKRCRVNWRYMEISLQLSPIVDLSLYLSGGELVAFNVDAHGKIYTLVAQRKLDYRTDGSRGASFAKTKPDTAQSYRALAFYEANVVLDVQINEEKFNIHDIQPLPNDGLLLVCGRSYYRSADDFEMNGRIYSNTGQMIRAILLGDGIQDVQVTSKGVIWTSFFDEGVLGNYGWREPIGKTGLVAWDAQGNKTYEFEPKLGLDNIFDCYALNVVSDSSVWFYYYTDFPLVHLRNQRVEAYWEMPIRGSSTFAVSNSFALFSGGYDERDQYHLFELRKRKRVKKVGSFDLVDNLGKAISAERIVGRAHALYIFCDNKVYRLEAALAISA